MFDLFGLLKIFSFLYHQIQMMIHQKKLIKCKILRLILDCVPRWRSSNINNLIWYFCLFSVWLFRTFERALWIMKILVPLIQDNVDFCQLIICQSWIFFLDSFKLDTVEIPRVWSLSIYHSLSFDHLYCVFIFYLLLFLSNHPLSKIIFFVLFIVSIFVHLYVRVYIKRVSNNEPKMYVKNKSCHTGSHQVFFVQFLYLFWNFQFNFFNILFWTSLDFLYFFCTSFTTFYKLPFFISKNLVETCPQFTVYVCFVYLMKISAFDIYKDILLLFCVCLFDLVLILIWNSLFLKFLA